MDELAMTDAYWRAANYLTVGQIYLMANPLLREPPQPEHIKPRLLGHWGTSPRLNLLYALLRVPRVPVADPRLTYRRTNHDSFHVRGYREEGTTTTPFDMVMRYGEDSPEVRDWAWPGD